MSQSIWSILNTTFTQKNQAAQTNTLHRHCACVKWLFCLLFLTLSFRGGFVAQARLELLDPVASTSAELGLQPCTTTPWSYIKY